LDSKVYAEVFSTGERLKAEALTALGFHRSEDNASYVALNTLPWSRAEIVQLPIKSQTSHFGRSAGGTGIMEVQPLTAASPNSTASVKEIKKDVFQLSNEQFVVQVSRGVITSVFDVKAKREVLAKGGKANQFVIFDDKPLYWQAWDVEVYHLESRKELSTSRTIISERGPHRVSVTTETRISDKSWLKSTVKLAAVADATSSLIEVDTEVEWRESMKFLKVEFPVDVRNTEAIVRRPTHYNTSWDMAKFEVCCHKWADLSEAGYGVSIINDSKYGFATCGNLMRLSLLRAPKAPDAHADMGKCHLSFLNNSLRALRGAYCLL
jgi:alpha-mannosidase